MVKVQGALETFGFNETVEYLAITAAINGDDHRHRHRHAGRRLVPQLTADCGKRHCNVSLPTSATVSEHIHAKLSPEKADALFRQLYAIRNR